MIELTIALTQSRVAQKAGLLSKARHLVKGIAKKVRRKADSTNSRALDDMCSEFTDAKSDLLLRFGADDESAVTMVVWDFGGQRVSCVAWPCVDAIVGHEACSACCCLIGDHSVALMNC